MKKLLAFMLLFAASSCYAASYYDGTVISTTTKKATKYISGDIKVYNTKDSTTNEFEISGGSITKVNSISARTITATDATISNIIANAISCPLDIPGWEISTIGLYASGDIRVDGLSSLRGGIKGLGGILDIQDTASFSSGIGFLLKDISNTRGINIDYNTDSTGSSGSYISFHPWSSGQIAGFQMYPTSGGNGSSMFLYATGYPGAGNYERANIQSNDTGLNLRWQRTGTGVARAINIPDGNFTVGNDTFSITNGKIKVGLLSHFEVSYLDSVYKIEVGNGRGQIGSTDDGNHVGIRSYSGRGLGLFANNVDYNGLFIGSNGYGAFSSGLTVTSSITTPTITTTGDANTFGGAGNDTFVYYKAGGAVQGQIYSTPGSCYLQGTGHLGYTANNDININAGNDGTGSTYFRTYQKITGLVAENLTTFYTALTTTDTITAPRIKLTEGASLGKVLLSDANGIGSWATLGGGGNMVKAIYDVADSGIVDNAEGVTKSGSNSDVIVENATGDGIATNKLIFKTISATNGAAINIPFNSTNWVSSGTFVNMDTMTVQGSIALKNNFYEKQTVKDTREAIAAFGSGSLETYAQTFYSTYTVTVNTIEASFWREGSTAGSIRVALANKDYSIIQSSTILANSLPLVYNPGATRTFDIPDTTLTAGTTYVILIGTGSATLAANVSIETTYTGMDYYTRGKLYASGASFSNFTLVNDGTEDSYFRLSYANKTGYYASNIMDTLTTGTTWTVMSATSTIPSNTAVKYYIKTSTATDNFASINMTEITGSTINLPNRYAQFISSHSRTSTNYNAYTTSVTITAQPYTLTPTERMSISNGTGDIAISAKVTVDGGFYPKSGSSLPVTGYDGGTFFWNTSTKKMYVSSETVTGTYSWKALW